MTVSVDGHEKHMTGFPDTVRSVLAKEHVKVGPRDYVSPGLTSSVHDGSVVTVRHARLLRLTVDRVQRPAWVTALSVGDALDQLGYRAPGMVVSAPGSRSVPLGGMAVDIRLPKRVVVLADGRGHYFSTTATSVGAMVKQSGVRLAKADRLSVSPAAYPTEGMRVSVARISDRRAVTTTAIAAAVVQRPDPTLDRRQTRVVDRGQPGTLEQVWTLTYTNGRVTHRHLVSSRVVVAPRPRIVAIGTKVPAPVPAAAPAAQPAAGPVPTTAGWGTASWLRAEAVCIMNHESGGDYTAQNPISSASGAYQMMDETYQAYARMLGLPNYIHAKDAPPSQQDAIFIYAATHGGLGNWNGTNCPGT